MRDVDAGGARRAGLAREPAPLASSVVTETPSHLRRVKDDATGLALIRV